MVIGIDIRTVCGEKDGKGHYTFNIVKNLLELDKVNKYVLYSKDKPLGFYEFENTTIKLVKNKSIFWHIKVARMAVKDGVDLFFSPTSYIIPSIISKKVKQIVAVHDLVAILFPQNHNKKAVFVEKLLLKRTIKRASVIAAVSDSTKRDLIRTFNIDDEKIMVVGCGVSDDFKVLSNNVIENIKRLKRYPEKFILSLGTIIPRKNYINLVKAFSRFLLRNREYKLVIVGGKKWGVEELENMIKKLQIEDSVILYGYASKNDIIEMYNLASCFVFVSIYEGFGIPPLEAMTCGCPVITSNVSSLPEVVGKAAMTVSPSSVDDILKAIRSVVLDKSLSEKLRKRGFENIKKFSWESSAQKILNIIKSI